MVVFAGACNQAAGSILYLLNLFQNILRHIIQKRIAVVKLGGYKSIDENLGSL